MRNYKVVIIDDEPWTREAIKQLTDWKNLGIEIAGEASDGEYGLELIRQTMPDIILTDVNMPGLNGIELMNLLREEKNDALVIFISGYDNFEYIRGALKVDAVDYLLKPVKADELNHQLQQCIKRLKDTDPHGIEVTGEFLNEKWANTFYEMRSLLKDSLNSSDINVVNDRLKGIYNIVKENSEKNISKSVMVGVYYTLINVLQQFITSYSYQLEDIFTKENTTFVFSRDASFDDMMEFVTHLYMVAYDKIQEQLKNRGRIDIEKIKLYVKEHFTEGITLEETAASFYVSKEYLSKLFKNSEGKGFLEYVTMLRMEYAKELIVGYKVPIKEVGNLVGYVEQAHFYKVFKKYYGKTPGEFRKQSFEDLSKKS